MTETQLGDRCHHGIQLRRFPVPVHARGRAVNVVGTGRLAGADRVLDARVALDAVAKTLMADGRALGYSAPGNHVFDGASARAAVLYIPLTAHTYEYPRSVNKVPVRLVRVAPARAL